MYKQLSNEVEQDDFTDSSKQIKPLEIFSINNKFIYTLNKSLLFERKSKSKTKVRVNGLNLSEGKQNLFELARVRVKRVRVKRSKLL